MKSKMMSRVNQKDIIAVQHTYIPPHVKGDKDFDGDCDLSSTAGLKISADQTKLYIELYFKAKEPHSDSKQRGLANFTKDFTKNGLVKKWVFAGDMNGKFDSGSQPKITIETNVVSILVKEN